MTHRSLFVRIFLWLGAAVAHAAAPAEPDNAAVLYKQAAKDVPRAEGKGERHVLLDVMATPVNAWVDTIVRRGEAVLALFDGASDATVCDWHLPTSRASSFQM